MTMIQRLLAMMALLALGACGGGGGSSGTQGFGSGSGSGGGTGGTPALSAASIILTLSASSVANDGTQTVDATVLAVDANNNTVAGVPVTIGVDSGYATPSGSVTDAKGGVTATIGIGSNHSNRTINVTATSGTLTQTAQLKVVAASGSAGTAKIAVVPSSTTVTSAAPVTVTATVTDATGNPVAGVVVSFSTTNGLGAFSASSALTNAFGAATVTMSPSSASVTGADTIVASATLGTSPVNGSAGFSLVASTASITSFTTVAGALPAKPLSAYGQTVLTVVLSGVSSTAPVTLSIGSACVAVGKAKISPSSVAATSSPVTFTYQDTGGCGSTLAADTLTASISGTAGTGTQQASLPLYLSSPAANNIIFVSASPQTIYLQGTGLTTSSQVTFQVNDAANNPLPGQVVTLGLTTSVGGLSLTGQSPQTTNSNGQVSILVNSGTVPTPVRVTASLASGISTVSSNLAVAVGLPSELNFSLSQNRINIEGLDLDGTSNSYTIIASDRLGNPVPDNTAINFVTEGGQVQAVGYTAGSNGLSRATAQFQTSQPRPPDGRVTVLAYALGEKSFIDADGNNVYGSGEAFQDLGNPYLDTLYNGVYASAITNQYIAQSPAGAVSCNTDTLPASLPSSLRLDVSVPSQPGTCTGSWGKVYVRRAVETIFSSSSARPIWGPALGSVWPAGSAVPAGSCSSLSLIQPNLPPFFPAYGANGVPNRQTYFPFGAAGLYVGAGNTSGVVSFLVADANPVALNPVAAGSTISVAGTTGMTVAVLGGSPVPSTNVPSAVSISYSFTAPVTAGTMTVTIASPGGLATVVSQYIQAAAPPGGYSLCP